MHIIVVIVTFLINYTTGSKTCRKSSK